MKRATHLTTFALVHSHVWFFKNKGLGQMAHGCPATVPFKVQKNKHNWMGIDHNSASFGLGILPSASQERDSPFVAESFVDNYLD